MKISVLETLQCCAATILVCACASQVQAQTNVTLYGRVDSGVDFQTNVRKPDGSTGNLLRAAGNQWGTSMFGFKGSEDLGGGLQAFFLLESGFDSSKGTTNGPALFNRRSYVGLASPTWGSVKIGSNKFLDSGAFYSLDPGGQQFIGTPTLVRGRSWLATTNMVEYQTPNWNGFNAATQISLGEQAGSTTALRKDAVLLVYATPSLEVRAVYDVVRNIDGNYVSIFETSKELMLGGTLTLDKLKLFAGYQNLRSPQAVAGAADKANHYWVGANYLVAPALKLIGGVFRITTYGGGAGSANLFMTGLNYDLSKRTLLYTTVGQVRNSATANFSVEASGNNPLAGEKQIGGYLGISHSF